MPVQVAVYLYSKVGANFSVHAKEAAKSLKIEAWRIWLIKHRRSGVSGLCPELLEPCLDTFEPGACVSSALSIEWRLFVFSKGVDMTLQHTPLDALHRELEGRMVPFAGYDMPVQFPRGIIKEHLHTRHAAGLFDVSHMGQLIIEGEGSTALLESLVPVDIESLGANHSTYALLTNDAGGVRDDLIITRWAGERFFLVVNAACKEQDIAYIESRLGGQQMTILTDQALLALQGPAARKVMAELFPEAANLVFMQGCSGFIDGVEVYVTCSGYTGEDGFEVSVAGQQAEAIARRLLEFSQVEPIGLGARDSLRLEAGLCLYGHELSPEITPVQAGLVWSISKERRADGARPGGFPGADIILQQIIDKPMSVRVGLKGDGKRPMREGQAVVNQDGIEVGTVCSAGYGASVGGPIAMAYVERKYAEPGTSLAVSVREKLLPASVAKMPFNPQRYFRG
jgi:aminomethyltransferase